MMRIYFVSTLVLAALLAISGQAQEAEGLSEADMKALKQTQEVLENPKLRQNFFKENSEAAKVDKNVRELGGTKENSEEIYSISSDIAATLVQQTGGDPAKLQELLQEALKNPEAFAGKLSPEQIQRIKKVSEKIDAQNVKKP